MSGDGRQRAASFSDNRIMPYQGIWAIGLGPAQAEFLMQMIATMLSFMPNDLAREKLADIRSHLSETYFAGSVATMTNRRSSTRFKTPSLSPSSITTKAFGLATMSRSASMAILSVRRQTATTAARPG
jgi:Protein of unknown function (DUF3500)